jgi:hypothetical protein
MKEKLDNSVFITRKIRFAMKSSEDSVCDDASSDEHPAVATGECNDDPGGGLVNHTRQIMVTKKRHLGCKKGNFLTKNTT